MKKILIILLAFWSVFVNAQFGLNTIFFNQSYSEPPVSIPTDDLVAWYKLDGNGNDEQNNWDLTEYGTVSYGTDRHSNSNSCCYLNGSSYLEVLNFNRNSGTAGTPFSISFWCKSSLTSTQSCISNRLSSASSMNFFCALISGLNYGQSAYGSSVVTVNSSSSYSTTEWFHYCLISDGTSYINLYLNNSLVDNQPFTGNLNDALTSPLTIGRTSYNTSNYLTGYMDDIRIYNRILTTDEITLLYNE